MRAAILQPRRIGTMHSVDAMRLLATSLIAMVAVTTAIWLLRRPDGIRRIVYGCLVSLTCMAVPAAVMAFGPMPSSERIIGHVSVVVPAADPYYEVPPPEAVPADRLLEISKK